MPYEKEIQSRSSGEPLTSKAPVRLTALHKLPLVLFCHEKVEVDLSDIHRSDIEYMKYCLGKL